MRTWSRVRAVTVWLVASVALVLLAANARSLPTEAKPSSRFEFLQIRMAVPVRITVYAADEPAANHASRLAFARFKELDRLLSDYDPHSELSRLCATAQPGQPVAVSRELFTVLKRARDISALSEGAFDVTVGPLTDLWRKVRRRGELPPDAERQAALASVGWESVKLDEDAQTVTLARSSMRLDLGGIAKGFAVDEALRVMAETGVTCALVDAGGDVAFGDPPPDAPAWRIGIAPLDMPRGTPDRFLELKNMAVATSGDASQHVEIDGVRYSHIVNPRTGLGVTTRSSVTVLAADGMTADGLASAVSVLGPEAGIALIESLPGAEALIVTRGDDGQIARYVSSGLTAFLDPGRDTDIPIGRTEPPCEGP